MKGERHNDLNFTNQSGVNTRNNPFARNKRPFIRLYFVYPRINMPKPKITLFVDVVSPFGYMGFYALRVSRFTPSRS